MEDIIKQFCFTCEEETEFKHTAKIWDKGRRSESGYHCLVCKGSGTCDDDLRDKIIAARGLTAEIQDRIDKNFIKEYTNIIEQD